MATGHAARIQQRVADVAAEEEARLPPRLGEIALPPSWRGRIARHLALVADDPTAGERPPIDGRAAVAEMQAGARAAALADAIPPGGRYAATRAGLAVLDDDQHPRLLASWLGDPDRMILVLAGPSGTGKSYAARALAAEAAIRGAGRRSGDLTVTTPQVVRVLTQETYLAALRPDGSPEAVWLTRHRARAAGLLVIDDLGAEVDRESSEHARRELVDLLEHRANHGLRTVATTNLPSKVVAERLGDRLASRLRDHGTHVIMNGPDRRAEHSEEW